MEEVIQQSGFEQPKKSSALKIVFVILSIIIILIILGIIIYFVFFKTNVPEGAVNWKDDGKNIYCIDSDGGADSSRKGILKLYDRKGNEIQDSDGEIYEDSCFGENKVMEYSCTPGDIEEIIDCENGCQEGVCLSEPKEKVIVIPEGAISWEENGNKTYCIDSDGGSDIYQKGILTLYDEMMNEIKDSDGEIYEDSCFGNNKVMEYSCTAGDIEETFDCENGCQEGSCVR